MFQLLNVSWNVCCSYFAKDLRVISAEKSTLHKPYTDNNYRYPAFPLACCVWKPQSSGNWMWFSLQFSRFTPVAGKYVSLAHIKFNIRMSVGLYPFILYLDNSFLFLDKLVYLCQTVRCTFLCCWSGAPLCLYKLISIAMKFAETISVREAVGAVL